MSGNNRCRPQGGTRFEKKKAHKEFVHPANAHLLDPDESVPWHPRNFPLEFDEGATESVKYSTMLKERGKLSRISQWSIETLNRFMTV